MDGFKVLEIKKSVFENNDREADLLRQQLKKAGVTVRTGCVKGILTENGRVCGVRTEAGTVGTSWVILATGGLSYPATGSTGDGYRMAKALGHERFLHAHHQKQDDKKLIQLSF